MEILNTRAESRSPVELILAAFVISAFVAACGGGGGGDSGPKYTVGGSVSGLAGSGLVLSGTGSNLTVSTNGNFTFPNSIANGTAYAVTVTTQPTNPSQTCAIANGTATVTGANVTNVTVTCTTNQFAISGTVTGLTGTGLNLSDGASGTDTMSATAFSFPALASGTAYTVTVTTQPSKPTQTCSVANGTGTVGSAAITNVAVSCSTQSFSVVPAVSGLLGSGLVLQNNAGDDLTIAADGNATFATKVASGAAYAVTIKTQPASPAQTCVVTDGKGTVGGTDVATPRVTCTMSPGRFAYVTGAVGAVQNIHCYAIDAVHGNLVNLEGSSVSSSYGSVPCTGAGMNLFSGLATDPAGKFLFAGNAGGIGVYAIDNGTGLITPVAGGGSSNPISAVDTIVVDPSGKFVYAAELDPPYGILGWAFDSVNKTMTPVPGSPYASPMGSSGSLAVDTSGHLYLTDASHVFGYAINSTTGALTAIPGATVSASSPGAIRVDPSGKFIYATSTGFNSVSAWTIDSTTGNLTGITGSGFPAGSTPADIVVDPSSKFVYVSNAGSKNISGFRINSTTGALTALTGSPFASAGGLAPGALAVHPSGQFMYSVLSNASVGQYTLDATTGAVTAFTSAPVPVTTIDAGAITIAR